MTIEHVWSPPPKRIIRPQPEIVCPQSDIMVPHPAWCGTKFTVGTKATVGTKGEHYAPAVAGFAWWLLPVAGFVTLSGSDVTTWRDAGPNGYNASGGTSPSWTASDADFSNKPSVTFTAASSEYLEADGASALFTGDDTPWTLFIAQKSTTAAVDATILSADSSSTVNPLQRWVTGLTNTRYRVLRRPDGGGLTVVNAPNNSSDTNSNIICLRFSGTTVSLWENNTNLINEDALDVAAVTVDQVTIGAQRPLDVAAAFWGGKIAEILLYGTALSTADRQAQQVRMAARYGITLA